MHRLATVLALITLVLTGCGGGAHLDSDVTGKTWSYVPGLPEFDFEAVVKANASISIADIYLSVPRASLTFVRGGGRFFTVLEISARIRVPESDVIVSDRAWAETTWTDAYEGTQTGDPLQLQEQMPLPQGTHILEVTLEDRNTGKRSLRRQEITAFNLESGNPALGRIRFDQPGKGHLFSLVISGFVPAGLDSVRSSVELFNIPADSTSRITFLLTEHRADTIVANAPYEYSPVLYQPNYRELKSTHVDTLEKATTLIRGVNGEVSAVFYLPPLKKGMYRLTCGVRVPRVPGRNLDTLLLTSRVFTVEPSAYPKPSTLEELIDAFRYIGTKDEMALLQNAPLPRRKEIFDSLWLSFTHDPEQSASLLRRYYTRVEEANKQFTAIKEGWKTDQGMVYIVLGPPTEVTTSGIDIVQWHYELPRTAAITTFTFRRAIVEGEGITFKEYNLIRLADFEIPWEFMVGKWRTGTVF